MATRRRRAEDVPVYFTEVGAPDMFKEDLDTDGDRYTASSNANRRDPDKIDEIFENAFMNHIKHTPFEPDEIQIYRYGIHIRPRDGVWGEAIETTLKGFLSGYPGSSIHVVQEGEETVSIRINLGSKAQGELAHDVSRDLRKQKELLTDIYAAMRDEFGHFEWFAFWETEEQLGYEG